MSFLLGCAEAFYFDDVPIVIFAFVSHASRDISRKKLLQLMSKRLLLVFSSMIFMVSSLIFWSLIPFEFIFVYGVEVVQFHSSV